MTEEQPPQEHPDFTPPGGPVQPPPGQYPPPPEKYQPPPTGQAWTTPPILPKGGRGSIWLGVGISIATLLGWWGISTAVPYDSPFAATMNSLVVVLPFVLVVAGIVMAAIPRTTRTGAGILIGIGAGILVAGGLCIALLATFSG